MCDDDIHPGRIEDISISRRTLGLTALMAAGLASAGGAAVAADKVKSTDVNIKTADGTCDAVLFHPEGAGTWPAVLVWPDIAGLRPAFRDLGQRLAGQGYVVLVVNPFYRSAKAPVVEGAIDLSDPELRKRLFGYRGAMSDAGIDSDARAFLAFLDAQKVTDTKAKAGVQGYCMGGTLSFRTAAAVPDRIGAVGSFHGGNGLVSAEPNSPHLLIPKTKAAFLVAHAENDDAQAPQMKEDLKAAFAAAKRPATVEVYPAKHGWCVPGSAVYDRTEAERAWSALSALYKKALV